MYHILVDSHYGHTDGDSHYGHTDGDSHMDTPMGTRLTDFKQG